MTVVGFFYVVNIFLLVNTITHGTAEHNHLKYHLKKYQLSQTPKLCSS